jgi:hypothetical protein
MRKPVRQLALLTLLLWGCSSLPPVIPEAETGIVLSVEKSGSGDGVITSTPVGINCGTDCTAEFEAGTVVTLTAQAGSGSTFAGWQGGCTGMGGCVVELGADATVTAEFRTGSGGEAGDPANDPGDEPVDPGGDPADPGDDPSDPGDEPVDPGGDPADPGNDPTNPGTDPTDPGDTPTDSETYGELLYSESAFDSGFTRYGLARTVRIDGNRALVIEAGGGDVSRGAALIYINSPSGWQLEIDLPVVDIMGNESTGGGALSNGFAAVGYQCGVESSDPCWREPSGYLVFEFGNGTWDDVANFRGEVMHGNEGDRLEFAGDYLFASRDDSTVDVHQREDGAWPVAQEIEQLSRGQMAASGEHFFRLSGRGIDYYRLVGGAWEYRETLDQARQGGTWIDFDGERLVYSRAEGEVTSVYALENGSWVKVDDIDRFGPVALAGDHLLIGDPMNDDMATDAGAVHVFRRSGSDWHRVNTIYADEPGPDQKFGNRLDATEEFAIVGSYEGDYDRSDFLGAFHIFGHGSPD